MGCWCWGHKLNKQNILCVWHLVKHWNSIGDRWLQSNWCCCTSYFFTFPCALHSRTSFDCLLLLPYNIKQIILYIRLLMHINDMLYSIERNDVLSLRSWTKSASKQSQIDQMNSTIPATWCEQIKGHRLKLERVK